MLYITRHFKSFTPTSTYKMRLSRSIVLTAEHIDSNYTFLA